MFRPKVKSVPKRAKNAPTVDVSEPVHHGAPRAIESCVKPGSLSMKAH